MAICYKYNKISFYKYAGACIDEGGQYLKLLSLETSYNLAALHRALVFKPLGISIKFSELFPNIQLDSSY